MRDVLESELQAWPLPSVGTRGTRALRWLRTGFGLCLLIAAYLWVDHGEVRARFAQLRVEYLLIAMAIAVPQLGCLAWRWRLTATRLGVPLSQRAAVHEYALSLLLNQLLPWGMLGDALRVLRKARSDAARAASADGTLRSAVHSVVVDRCIGQAVVIAWACAAAPLWLGAGALGVGLWLGLALVLLAGLQTYLVQRWARQPLAAAGSLRGALQRLCLAFDRVLGSRRALSLHALLSSAIVVSLVAQLYCALWALGLSLPPRAALQIFPFMLLSMTVPALVAGFGPREAATATLYRAAHMSAADGLAFALAYGALMLSMALPWLLCWALSAPSDGDGT